MEDIKAVKKENSQKLSGNQSSSGKKLLITIVVALVLIISIWIWKSIEIKNIRNNAESNYRALKEQAVKSIVASKAEQLKLLAKSYIWAVRTEMMKANISQVNLYANDMIKEKNFLLIAIANDSGMIVSSTDKKDEGKLFSSIGEGAALTDNNTTVTNTSDSVLTVTSPIMGFNNRLGTLFIKYAVQQPDFK